MPSAPYEAVWSNNEENHHRNTALTALLFVVLILAPIASQDRQNDMTLLLRSTSGGRKRLMLRKQTLLFLITVTIWLAVYGTEVHRTVAEYGALSYLTAPANSLPWFDWSLSIVWTLVLYYGAKLLVMVTVGEICFLLSSRCDKNRDAILLCSGVLLIPAALAAIGSSLGEYLSFVLPLGGVELFR